MLTRVTTLTVKEKRLQMYKKVDPVLSENITQRYENRIYTIWTILIVFGKYNKDVKQLY